jgi:DNA repair protein RecN (Recombination protein N)
MLRELRVKNLALIEEAHLSLSSGLTVLTGETGAGKSILIGALNLIAGGRAAGEVIRNGSEEAEVEGLFDGLRPGKEPDRGEELSPDAGEILIQEEILIRRVLTRSGKNRITVNGRLATLSLLEAIGETLVDFHRQNQQQTLRNRAIQSILLDGFAGLIPLRRQVGEVYDSVREKRRLLEEMTERERDRARREDFLRFQEKEISQALLQPGEDETLLRERKVLAHAERLSSLSQSAYQAMYGEEDSALGRMKQCEAWIREMEGIDPSASGMGESLSSILPQMEDLVHRLRSYAGRAEQDPERLAAIEERLHQIERLKKKYGGSVEEVLRHLANVESELRGLETAGEEIERLSRTVEEEGKRLAGLAEEMSQKRRAAAARLSSEVDRELSRLGMGSARFSVQVDPRPEEMGPAGIDRIDFMIAANPGEETKPLARIASGGELSRIMLAVKVVLAASDRLPTLIFDEVDTGIGGKVAEEVGLRLKRLSKKHQVACVTHLPQIASQADHHYVVEKVSEKGRTSVRVRLLDDRERVEEVARMLGGKTITPTTRRHAEEMLGK